MQWWCQLDPKAEAVSSLSPYQSMNNNPISNVDPEGDLPFFAVVGIYSAINVGINAAQGNINSFGDFAKHAAVGAANGALSTINPLQLNFGGGFGLGINPQIAIGTNGAGIGFNSTLGWSKWGIDAGVTAGGTIYGTAANDGAIGSEARLGFGIEAQYQGFNAGFSKMNFYSGETSQQTGMISAGYKSFKAKFDNDVLGDGGDRFRTSGVRAQYKDYMVGLNMFTGDPGLNPRDRRRTQLGGDPHGTYVATNGNDPDKFRFGGLFFGYKEYRAGVNSEQIRHFFQNRLIHDTFGAPHFRVLNNKWNPYFGHYSNNPHTPW